MADCRRALLVAAAIILLCGFACESEAKPRCVFALQSKSEVAALNRRQRSLLQTNCGFSFDNTAITFASCQNVTADLFWDYSILWDVVDGGNGASNSTFRGAIDAATGQGIQWAGFAFPPAGSNMMVGSSAIIVKACSTCSSGASVDSYFLASQDTSGVQPPGHLKVISMEAALSNGRLQAVFELSLPFTASDLNSPTDVLYATGPLGSDGSLQQHEYYLQDTLNLNAGQVASLTPSTGPTTTPAIAPVATAPTTATIADAPAASPAVGSAIDASSPSDMTAPVTANVFAPSPAPAAGTGNCSLDFAGNNSVLVFSQCQSLATSSSANSGIRLLWRASPSPAGNGSILTGALEATTSGWAGFGIPSTPGVMQGANAIIVKTCSSCNTGASADNYHLGGYDTSQVVPGTGKLNISTLEAAKTSSGTLQAIFTMYLPQSVSDLSNPLDVIASVGPLSSDDKCQAHVITNAYSGTVNLASGAIVAVSGGGDDNKPTIHGYLMVFGWGLLVPLGVVFARCKEWGALWFHLHRATQMLGYLTGLAGAAVAVAMGRQTRTHQEDVHRIIGLVVTIVLTIQVLAILWRPAPQHRYRFIFNYYHWVMGGSAILLACSNVFIGLHVAAEPARWSGLYGAAFGLVVLLYLGKAAYNRTLSTPQHKGMLERSGESDSSNEREGPTHTHVISRSKGTPAV